MRLDRGSRGSPLARWAGGLVVFYGLAHTLGALTALGAARHSDAWFSRQLWHEDFSDMSPAMSAYWLSVNSFGPPLTLVGLIVLWLNRNGLTPPPFIAWAMGTWVLVDTILGGPGVGQNLILMIAVGLLAAASRVSAADDGPVSHAASSDDTDVRDASHR